MNKAELQLILKEGEGLTVEFKERYTPKIDRDIVALTNAKGGFIVLGVTDKGKIIGERLTNTMKAEIISLARNCEPCINIPKISQIDNVVVLEISEGDEKPYGCSSGYFRRLDAVTQKMSQKELRMIFRQTADITFEDLQCKDFNFEHISFKKIKAFLEEAHTSFKVNKSNIASFLASLSIYKEGKINNVGALMFAADINRFIPHSETILGAFKGINKIHIYDRKDVRNDLLSQFNESILFLQKHLNVRSEIRGVNRYDIYEIPIDALREAVVNAIIHRDYSMRGTNISVNVFDDRVEIVNPGGLPVGIDKTNFGKESVRRNPIIADLFHRMEKVERVGSGIGRMQELMAKSGLKEPVFESDTFFRAIFYRKPEYALKHTSEESVKTTQKTIQRTTQKTTQKILEIIKQNPYISRKELANIVGITEAGVKFNLNQLKEKGIIHRVGPDKGGYWEVIK
ncbi:MAG: helix-turn-helix domain-containing protein [bacterium]